MAYLDGSREGLRKKEKRESERKEGGSFIDERKAVYYHVKQFQPVKSGQLIVYAFK